MRKPPTRAPAIPMRIVTRMPPGSLPGMISLPKTPAISPTIIQTMMLVDTEGLILKAKVHSAKVPDQDGIKLLLKTARKRLPRLSHLWVDAGYQGRGKEWVEQELGLSVEVVHRTPKPTPEKTARIWAQEWAKEGREIDWQKLLPRRRGFEVLPRRWVVERTFSWLSQNRRLSKDYERLCATSEAFIYAAMTRIMVRRLANT